MRSDILISTYHDDITTTLQLTVISLFIFLIFGFIITDIKPPFNVWNERVVGGHPHFITGAGGFLQNVMFGYGGLRLTESALLIVNPLLPLRSHAVVFRNVSFIFKLASLRLC